MLDLTDADVLGIQAEIQVYVSVGFLCFQVQILTCPNLTQQQQKQINTNNTLSVTIGTLCVNR